MQGPRGFETSISGSGHGHSRWATPYQAHAIGTPPIPRRAVSSFSTSLHSQTASRQAQAGQNESPGRPEMPSCVSPMPRRAMSSFLLQNPLLLEPNEEFIVYQCPEGLVLISTVLFPDVFVSLAHKLTETSSNAPFQALFSLCSLSCTPRWHPQS